MADGPNVGLGSALAPLEGDVLRAPTSEPEAELFDLDGPDGALGPVTQARDRARRGPGRPPGSPNKRTEDLRRFILARFKHPVVALAEIYSMPADELASYLGCDRLDALALQVKAAAEAAPFVDSKMPQRVQITDRDRLPSFGLEFAAGGMSVVDPAGNRISLTALAVRAKDAMAQRVSAGELSRSHDDGSHDGSEAIDPLTYSDD